MREPSGTRCARHSPYPNDCVDPLAGLALGWPIPARPALIPLRPALMLLRSALIRVRPALIRVRPALVPARARIVYFVHFNCAGVSWP